MQTVLIFTIMVFFGVFHIAIAQESFKKDVISTSAGTLNITFIGHGSLMMTFDGKIIHIDPYSKVADYTMLPKADLIIVTHDHSDHFDPAALQSITTSTTQILLPLVCADKVPGAIVMNNDETREIFGITIKAVPAYNLVHKRENGQPFHPKGVGNGYVVTFGDTKIYVAGDTENIPEMQALQGIDIAFLPMNLPYTMTPQMVADAARSFRPKILYPYHYGETDPTQLTAILQDDPAIEVRIRPLR